MEGKNLNENGQNGEGIGREDAASANLVRTSDSNELAICDNMVDVHLRIWYQYRKQR